MQLPRRPRLVVDTNVWVSYMLTRSFSRLPAMIRTGRVLPLISRELVDELSEVLDRPKLRKRIHAAQASRFIALLQLTGQYVEPTTKVEACRDPKDNYLLALAVDGKADILLTGDDDLVVLDPFQGVRIMGPALFLRWFK